MKKSRLEVNIDFLFDFDAKLALFWRHFGRPGRLWGHLGASWARLGASWRPLGASLAHLVRHLARLGASWPPSSLQNRKKLEKPTKNHQKPPQHKPDSTWNGKRRSFEVVSLVFSCCCGLFAFWAFWTVVAPLAAVLKLNPIRFFNKAHRVKFKDPAIY